MKRFQSVFAFRLISKSNAGFTLFEVLVATMIFALGILAVVQGRTNSTRNVLESEKSGIATQLAQAKMAEAELKYQAQIDQASASVESVYTEEEGKFEDPFAAYSWKIKLRESKIKFSGDDIKDLLKKFGVSDDEAEIQLQSQMIFLNNLNKALKNNFVELWVEVQWDQFGKKRSVPVVTHLIPSKPKMELTLDEQ